MNERLIAIEEMQYEWMQQKKRIMFAVQNLIEMVEEQDATFSLYICKERDRMDAELRDIQVEQIEERKLQEAI